MKRPIWRRASSARDAEASNDDDRNDTLTDGTGARAAPAPAPYPRTLHTTDTDDNPWSDYQTTPTTLMTPGAHDASGATHDVRRRTTPECEPDHRLERL